MMLKCLFSFLCLWLATVSAITVTTSSSSYVVDTGSSYNFIVTISRTNCDITSIRFYGSEYQDQGTFSHIGSGLGSGTAVSGQTNAIYEPRR